jgi:hypothetical protein
MDGIITLIVYGVNNFLQCVCFEGVKTVKRMCVTTCMFSICLVSFSNFV